MPCIRGLEECSSARTQYLAARGSGFMGMSCPGPKVTLPRMARQLLRLSTMGNKASDVRSFALSLQLPPATVLLKTDDVRRSKPAILTSPRLCCVPATVLLRDGPLP
jgi:hypothetical protein